MDKIKKQLAAMAPRFDELQTHLLHKFGNEGADIGDAANILELISNTCIRDADADAELHDSYTAAEMMDEIAKFYSRDRVEIRSLVKRIDRLNNSEYTKLAEEVS